MSYPKKFVPLLAGMMLVLLLAAGFISLKSKSPERANFSGDWELNKSKSDIGRLDIGCFTDFLYAFTIMKIDGQEGFLIADVGGPSPEGTLVTRQEKLTFDGRESEASLFGNTKKKSTVKWSDDGQTMTVNSVIYFDITGEKSEMKVTEIWKLINNGRSISLQSNSNSTRGENAMRLVYDRTTDSEQELIKNKPDVAKIVFKSTDGGQTWQDISEGLPENLKDDLGTDDFFVNETGLHLRAYDGIYHNKPNSTTPLWEKENSPHKLGSLAPAKAGINANNGDSQFVQKINAMSAPSSIYRNFREGLVRTTFETAGAAVFIATDRDLFKSTNSGKTWKKVISGGMGMKLVESNGVILATAANGIIRSTDDGENWEYVLSEDGISIALERIKGGFAAIIASRYSKSTIVRASYNGGETWQPIDAGLPAALGIASIIEVGEYFFCGHPAGIFRSADKGKTWNLLVPSIENKVFNLYVSGNVIYAIPLNAPGC